MCVSVSDTAFLCVCVCVCPCVYVCVCRPGGEVGSAQVDVEVPAPVLHVQQILHTPQISLQQAGSAPDGHHAPGRGTHVRILLGQLLHLPVQIVGALNRGPKQVCHV